MARIKYETAQAFLRGEAHKDNSAFRSTGEAIYSYAMRLAHWHDGRIVFDYEDRKRDAPSATTNAHMIALEGVVGTPADPDVRCYAADILGPLAAS